VTDPFPSHSVVPPWSTPIDACRLILRGVTFRTCMRVAIVVGTILTAVNQGSVIADGHASAATWIRVGVNYAVPFIVSSIGYLAPFRCREVGLHSDG
jgi:low temperature requirement protein LtrA